MNREKVLLNATICFLTRENQVLLGFKTKKIGKDRWNGYGGGIEPGENSKTAAVRELYEESGGKNGIGGIIAQPEDLEKIAVVDFHNTMSDGRKFVCRCHCYLVKKWTGYAQETDEMITPTWFNISALPLEKMMPADKDWLLPALSGKKVFAKAYLGPFQKEKLEPTEIEFVSSFIEE